MPDITDPQMLSSIRFKGLQQETDRNQEDEDLLAEIAQFIQITSDQVRNQTLNGRLKDIAAQLLTNKAFLARDQGQLGALEEEDEGMGGMPGQGALPPTGAPMMPPDQGMMPPM